VRENYSYINSLSRGVPSILVVSHNDKCESAALSGLVAFKGHGPVSARSLHDGDEETTAGLACLAVVDGLPDKALGLEDDVPGDGHRRGEGAASVTAPSQCEPLCPAVQRPFCRLLQPPPDRQRRQAPRRRARQPLRLPGRRRHPGGESHHAAGGAHSGSGGRNRRVRVTSISVPPLASIRAAACTSRGRSSASSYCSAL
jgi:hypothetical protein